MIRQKQNYFRFIGQFFFFLFLFLIVIPSVIPSSRISAAVTFPLTVSSNHRYLQDQAGTPFRIQGDSPWEASTDISLSDWRSYLDDRKSRGFNTVLVQITNPVKYVPNSIA